MRDHPSGVCFGRQEPREFGAKGANVKGVGSQKTRSAYPTYREVGKKHYFIASSPPPRGRRRRYYALGGGEEGTIRQSAYADGPRGRLAVVGASAVASGSQEGENEEPVRAQDEATDLSTPEPPVSYAAGREGRL